MVELLDGFPAHVAAYKAEGNVNDQEYQDVVMHRVEDVAAKFGRLNFLVLLETDFQNYSMPAFLNYLRISFKHFSRWERMAIVTDQKIVEKAYDMLSPFVHGEIRGFEIKDFEEAKTWVSGPLNHA